MLYRLTSTWAGSASLVTLAPCFILQVTISVMAMLTANALQKHNWAHIQSQRSREIHVKVYLMSGEIAGLGCMGESEETALTFAGSFHIADALAEDNLWVHRAKPDEEPDYKRRLQDGIEVGLIKIAPILYYKFCIIVLGSGHSVSKSWQLMIKNICLGWQQMNQNQRRSSER